MNNNDKTVQTTIHDLYQLLLAECRYGYKRNNHLMPDGAYSHVKTYLPLMFNEDADMALHTACQLCEECICEQLNWNFSDGLDDEYGNRKRAIEFIEYLLDWVREHSSNFYEPYNYSEYVENIEKEFKHKYRVFELDAFDAKANKLREITTEPLDKKMADEVLFEKELGVTSGIMNRVDITTDKYPIRVVGELIRIVEPKEFAGKIYSIELAE